MHSHIVDDMYKTVVRVQCPQQCSPLVNAHSCSDGGQEKVTQGLGCHPQGRRDGEVNAISVSKIDLREKQACLNMSGEFLRKSLVEKVHLMIRMIVHVGLKICKSNQSISK